MTKADDKVEISFLSEVLKYFGFSDKGAAISLENASGGLKEGE